ncbi:hypothetical protein DACRYDRAFT_102839 [Dacryopinax primogenitus]|uniref:Uncharacterized protein n=1 Tax=Dacryopinax primogenitus (strain DJM 731) TaxID=1858805 RepID=M5FMZ9_DACPD|nr:uncharacterized protein DACRYDRAFT_102839 [Dacryopinax primogenitus]EJT96575.1 hypothetical protein DACRYDRAFT_102839 [Dacryopinax primogenitus]
MLTPPLPIPFDGEAKHDPDDRRFSIEHALELERQLDAEDEDQGEVPNTKPVVPTVLDPDVLASIVIQQRTALAELTDERDELERALGKAHVVQSELHSQLSQVMEMLELERQRVSTITLELGAAREKATDDAESITMLRSKVEESRRGVMRLQSERESRRVSQFQPLQLDLSSASTTGTSRTPGFSTFSKRASVISTSSTPRSPTFMGHRRVSSLSDPGITPDASDYSSFPPFLVQTPSDPPTSSIPKTGGLSPPSSILPSLSPPVLISEEELASLRAELKTVRRELSQTKEAKEASDIVLRALREMMGLDPESKELPNPEQIEPLKGLSLPPLPTDELNEDAESLLKPSPSAEKKSASGWGLRLWRSTASPVMKPASPDPSLQGDTSSVVTLDASVRDSISSSQHVEAPVNSQTIPRSSSPIPPLPPRQPLFKGFNIFTTPTAPPVPEKDLVLPPQLTQILQELTVDDLVQEELHITQSRPGDLHVTTDVGASVATPDLQVQPPTAV